ncbi:MAG: tyrosine--tRNA ligase [Phycisphaerales bacterium]|nr:tyrosine--tRNA ligase [Phycisphaerales bacterium]
MQTTIHTTAPEQQFATLIAATDNVYTPAELKQRLIDSASANKPLRVKLGMDPTAPDLHLGHAVVLRKLRQFQDFGHKAVLIVGDFTAMIGDPTGKKKTRPVLSSEQVQQNAQTYFEQAGKILDTSPERLEIRRNSEWLAQMNFADALKLAQQMTVARMLERDTFSERHKAGEAIYIHEFMYPLMQGWDSVMVHADVELGGTDQTFNNLVGRDLQIAQGQKPQIVMIMPILTGTDGHQKMSKSLGNYVGVAEAATEQFGKTMSIPDDLMPQWFNLCTPLSADRIHSLIDPTQTHPREAKEVLGRLIVEQFHSAPAAQSAAEDFRRRFAGGELPSEIAQHVISAALLKDGRIGVLTLIKEAGFAPSTSEARRLVEGGGVIFAGRKISNPKEQLTLEGEPVLQVGKRRVCRVVMAPA